MSALVSIRRLELEDAPPEMLTICGVKLAEPRSGIPEMLRLTFPLNPFCGVTVIVSRVLRPCLTVSEVGEAEREKVPAGGWMTIRVTLTE